MQLVSKNWFFNKEEHMIVCAERLNKIDPKQSFSLIKFDDEWIVKHRSGKHYSYFSTSTCVSSAPVSCGFSEAYTAVISVLNAAIRNHNDAEKRARINKILEDE